MKTKFYSMMLVIAALVGFASCSDDDDKSSLSETSKTIKVGETFQLVYSDGNCAWSSDNDLIASVNNNGLVTGMHVGETTIHANNSTCKVKVEPNYTGVFEPCVQWGTNQANVKKYMSGYPLDEEASDDETLLYYGIDNNILLYTYNFENGKLDNSAFLATYTYAGDYLAYYLAERYAIYDVDEENALVTMVTPDMQMAVGYMVTDEMGVLVMYIPISSLTRANNISSMFINAIPENVKHNFTAIDKSEKAAFIANCKLFK